MHAEDHEDDEFDKSLKRATTHETHLAEVKTCSSVIKTPLHKGTPVSLTTSTWTEKNTDIKEIPEHK